MSCDFIDISSTCFQLLSLSIFTPWNPHLPLNTLPSSPFFNKVIPLHQIESKTGLGKSIIGRINKEMDGDKENSKGGHPSKLSSATSDQLSVKSPVEDLIMLWRLPISSTTSFLMLSHPKQSGMHSNKMTFVLLSRGNTLFSRRATDWSISNLPDTMKTGQWRIGRVPRSMQAVIKAKGGHTKY